MISAETAPLAWGRGDLYTLLIALVFTLVFCVVHRKALHAKGAECAEMLLGIVGSAMSVGPILMILLDPLNKWWGLVDIDLLRTVVLEARSTLWLACLTALINTLTSLFRARA